MFKIYAIIFVLWTLALFSFIVQARENLHEEQAKNAGYLETIAEKVNNINELRAEITRQNLKIEQMAAEATERQKKSWEAYDKLNKKYDIALKKANAKPDPSCEEQLKIIYETQEAFCYEK